MEEEQLDSTGLRVNGQLKQRRSCGVSDPAFVPRRKKPKVTHWGSRQAPLCVSGQGHSDKCDFAELGMRKLPLKERYVVRQELSGLGHS